MGLHVAFHRIFVVTTAQGRSALRLELFAGQRHAADPQDHQHQDEAGE